MFGWGHGDRDAADPRPRDDRRRPPKRTPRALGPRYGASGGCSTRTRGASCGPSRTTSPRPPHRSSAPGMRKVSSFVWSWDNDSIQAPLCATAEKVRAFGAEHGVGALTTSPLNLDEEQVRDLVALAFRLGGGTGLYHPYDGVLATYITFGPVTVEEAGGRTSTFEATRNVSPARHRDGPDRHARTHRGRGRHRRGGRVGQPSGPRDTAAAGLVRGGDVRGARTRRSRRARPASAPGSRWSTRLPRRVGAAVRSPRARSTSTAGWSGSASPPGRTASWSAPAR